MIWLFQKIRLYLLRRFNLLLFDRTLAPCRMDAIAEDLLAGRPNQYSSLSPIPQSFRRQPWTRSRAHSPSRLLLLQESPVGLLSVHNTMTPSLDKLPRPMIECSQVLVSHSSNLTDISTFPNSHRSPPWSESWQWLYLGRRQHSWEHIQTLCIVSSRSFICRWVSAKGTVFIRRIFGWTVDGTQHTTSKNSPSKPSIGRTGGSRQYISASGYSFIKCIFRRRGFNCSKFATF